MKKKFGPFFSCSIAHDKCQETVYKGPESLLTIIVKALRLFFIGAKRSLETNISQEKATIPMTKILAYFFRIIECDKPTGTVYKGGTGILKNTVEVVGSFL